MDDELTAAYGRCRAIHRKHGRTYYLATRLLPAAKRPHVHALYGFTRHADDIVDRVEPGLTRPERARALRAFSDRFLGGLAGGPVDDPILSAVLNTIATFDLDRADFASFLRSMAMDLEVAEYETYADLLGYMEGSAAVIGTMMLPILDPPDRDRAREPARQLGLAFQFTNFLRDIAEDCDRDRVYLPQEDLRRFGVTTRDLRAAARRRTAPPAVRALVRFEAERAHRHYAAAAPGVEMLTRASRACVRTAFHVYGGILGEIAAAGYDPFVRRAVVPRRRRLGLVVRSVLTERGVPVLTGGSQPCPTS